MLPICLASLTSSRQTYCELVPSEHILLISRHTHFLGSEKDTSLGTQSESSCGNLIMKLEIETHRSRYFLSRNDPKANACPGLS